MQAHQQFLFAEFNESKSWLVLFDFTALFWPVSLHMPVIKQLSCTHNTGAKRSVNEEQRLRHVTIIFVRSCDSSAISRIIHLQQSMHCSQRATVCCMHYLIMVASQEAGLCTLH